MMLKILGRIILLLVLVHSLWMEWSIMTHAGIRWGLFFGMYIIPFALFATLAIFPVRIEKTTQ